MKTLFFAEPASYRFAVVLMLATAACTAGEPGSGNTVGPTAAAADISPPVAGTEAIQSAEPDNDMVDTNYFAIETPQGRMVIRLFDETPGHRDNFRQLASDGFFDETTFHRVIEQFMIQGGDPNSRDGNPQTDGQGGPGYTQPAEIVDNFHHIRGAVAAARQGDAVNPERESSGSQFYIVHGRTFDDDILNDIEIMLGQQLNIEGFTFPDNVRQAYKTEGGAPHLDGQYTIFGELVEGFEVLDRIARSDTPRRRGERVAEYLMDQPVPPVPMKVIPLEEYEGAPETPD